MSEITLESINYELHTALWPILEDISAIHEIDMGNKIITLPVIEYALSHTIWVHSFKLGADKSKALVLGRAGEYLESHGWHPHHFENQEPYWASSF